MTGVTISPHTLIVRLDSHLAGASDKLYPTSEYALAHLLPSAEPDVEVGGIPYLRVKKAKGRDLHLGLIDGDANAIIRSADNSSWDLLLTQRRAALEGSGHIPLWDETSGTRYELDDEFTYRLTNESRRSMAWLGSFLLRRIALFHSTSSAYSTRSWITGDEWRFELDHHAFTSSNHEVFLDHLRDEKWGAPLRISEGSCNCHLRDRKDTPGYQCTYELTHPDHQRGTLQLRFRWSRDLVYGEREELRRTLGKVGARSDWLDNVLPARRPDTKGRDAQ